jgi:hypothetical protein
LVVIVHLRDSGKADLRGTAWLQLQKVQRWETVLMTEDPLFSPDPHPPSIVLAENGPVVEFSRPGAVILRAHRQQSEVRGQKSEIRRQGMPAC